MINSVRWEFSDFIYANEVNPIEEWRSGLSEEAQFSFDKILKDCRKTERHTDWVALRGLLKGKCAKHRIWELGFRSDKRQHRVLFVFDPNASKRVVLLVGCYHKQKVYTPKNALTEACNRAAMFKRGEGNCRERKVAIDQ
jgi:hypothetical protein